MKVFISYSTQDSKRAESLFEEVEGAGAEVFKWGRTEIIGKPTWPQILAWINQSDVFVVLISWSALASNPVQDEIDQAAYSYSNRRKPEKIVAAILEKGAEPPVIIERFARVDFTEFDSGLVRLMGQLGLKRRSGIGRLASSLAPITPLPDPSELFRVFKASHPDPLPANLWSREAAKIVTNYNDLKPKEISETTRKGHLDKILADFSGKTSDAGDQFAKYDNLLLQKLWEPPEPAAKAAETPKLFDLLLSSDPKWRKAQAAAKSNRFELTGFNPLAPLTLGPLMLAPPTLSGKGTGLVFDMKFNLTWTASVGASRYVLERSNDKEFQKAEVIFESAETHFEDREGVIYNYYRVKAIGPFTLLASIQRESSWSNVVCYTFL